MYMTFVSNNRPTSVAIVNPIFMNASLTPNLGAKCNVTNEYVELESNKHLTGVSDIVTIPSTMSSDA